MMPTFFWRGVRNFGFILLSSSIVVPDTHAHDLSSSDYREVTFTSWVGPYIRSQMFGFVRPYEEEHGLHVRVESYDGGIKEIRDQVESANVTWDVVDLTQADSLRACNEGLLEDISDIELPDDADGTVR